MELPLVQGLLSQKFVVSILLRFPNNNVVTHTPLILDPHSFLSVGDKLNSNSLDFWIPYLLDVGVSWPHTKSFWGWMILSSLTFDTQSGFDPTILSILYICEGSSIFFFFFDGTKYRIVSVFLPFYVLLVYDSSLTI